MYINKLRLSNFRNIKSVNMNFSDGVNIIYGKNAQGKTNILESLYFCSTGRSHRTKIDRELISFDEKFANISACFLKGKYEDNIEVSIKDNERKGIAFNKRYIKRIGELFGHLQIIIFSPEDLCIINDSPSERRRFMDIQICQINKIYYYHLHSYYQILKQRNKLLKSIKQNNINDYDDSLFVWDSQLVSHGIEIMNIREWFLDSINAIANKIHSEITAQLENLKIEYRPNTRIDEFEKRLSRCIKKDILYGSTSIGPHKDDISFSINGRDARMYCSQGQKRTVVLSCKLAEIEIVKKETNDTPILLLDDALSELDQKRQEMLMGYIGGMQTIVTATGMEDLITNIKYKAKIFCVENGIIKEENDV